MTTRIDLDNIDALARAAAAERLTPWRPSGEDGSTIASADGLHVVSGYPAPVALLLALQPDAVLALVTRLRDLEETALRAASLLEAGSDKSARREWARGIREHVERGAHAFRHGLPKAGAG